MDWVLLSSAIERNWTHRKEKKSIKPNRTFDFQTRDLCKTDVENPLPDLRSSSYFSPECSARVFRKRRNSAEMASDALWIVSFKCIVKGYQECRFDVKDGEVFRVLKKIGEKGRALIPNCKRARTIRSPSTWTGCFPVACKCFDNLVSEDVCKGFANILICLK